MKMKSLVGMLLGVIVLAPPVWAQPPAGAGVLAEVKRLEETWLQSEKTNNTDLLLPIIADGIVDTTTDGVLLTGKQAVIADAKAVKWTRAEYKNLQVSVFGDTAIATAIFDGKGTDSAGKAVDVHEQFTDVWVKMPSGAWQCVATHGTLIKK
jgi:ketosteroid isomerase-like protein